MPELITREVENLETTVLMTTVHGLQFFVLRSKATARSRIHYQEYIALMAPYPKMPKLR